MLKAEFIRPAGGTPKLAYRMVAIAFLNSNIAIAGIWGSFSVLLSFVESRLGVGANSARWPRPRSTCPAP